MDYLELYNGVKMPCVVMSTNYMNYQEMTTVVRAGLKLGYRAFDTARDYGNEHIVGKVMKECLAEAGLKREDVFITTKIGNSQQRLGNIDEQIDMSLNNLQTDYVDLWLMHWPYPGYYVETWHKMEKVYKFGKAHAIGMANYRMRHFEHLFKEGIDVMPHCIQMELHPMRICTELLGYLHSRSIQVQAYTPLLRMIEPIRNNPILKRIALSHNKTIGQIILRWHYQNKTVPVFKSFKPMRLAENINIFDFSLSDVEMSEISSMDEDYKYHIESASCPGF